MKSPAFLVNPDCAKLMQKGDLIVTRPAERDPKTIEPFASIGGVPFLFDEYVPKSIRVQFRKPKSKKSRIRKKWAKDSRNWRDVNVFWIVDTSKLYHIVPSSMVPPPMLGVPYRFNPSDPSTFITGLERGAYRNEP